MAHGKFYDNLCFCDKLQCLWKKLSSSHSLRDTHLIERCCYHIKLCKTHIKVLQLHLILFFEHCNLSCARITFFCRLNQSVLRFVTYELVWKLQRQQRPRSPNRRAHALAFAIRKAMPGYQIHQIPVHKSCLSVVGYQWEPTTGIWVV